MYAQYRLLCRYSIDYYVRIVSQWNRLPSMGEVKIVLTFDLGTVHPNQCTPVPMCKYLELKADI